MIGTLKILFERYFKINPLVVGAGTKTGVKIRMDNPREVGPDRIVHSAAAHQLYGGPLIIVDMGTATTFDTIIQKRRIYRRSDCPGFQTAAEALFARTAMLPRVKLARPSKAIGTNTIAAMQSGIVFGYISLIEGMINRIQKEFPEKARVLLPEDLQILLAKRQLSIDDYINPNLILIGLKIIYDMNKALDRSIYVK